MALSYDDSTINIVVVIVIIIIIIISQQSSDIFVNWNRIKTINNIFLLTETKTKVKIIVKT